MAIRIEPDLESTKMLLGQVLRVILVDNQRVSFLVAAGEGDNVCARIRVMISRRRKALQSGKNPRKLRSFKLCSSIHPETHEGKRHDCVVMWKHVTEAHLLEEQLEDMLHGEQV